MDFTGLQNSRELARRLNKLGERAALVLLELERAHDPAIDWTATTPIRVVLASGLAAELLRGEWVPMCGPSWYFHGETANPAVGLDYRLLWVEMPAGSWQKTYPTADEAAAAFLHLVMLIKSGERRLVELRAWLEARA